MEAPVADKHDALLAAKTGYDGHHLGDSLSRFTISSLKLVPRLWPAVMYTVPSHTLRLDTIPLSGISYEFWHGKLYQIDFNSRHSGLLEAGKMMYGPGEQVSPTEYRWQGQHSSASYTTNGPINYLRVFDNAAAIQVDSAVATAQ
ncbi:hypothetical protein GCM10022409_09230 [Hymenobacter glaciei]|uniref:Uncharacterized protein n=2 Tax=Hymenobacter glaciei TaxID=877209 RepID=A0ABP7TJU7_9BACT